MEGEAKTIKGLELNPEARVRVSIPVDEVKLSGGHEMTRALQQAGGTVLRGLIRQVECFKS